MYNTALQLITYSGLETEFIDIAWCKVAHAVKYPCCVFRIGVAVKAGMNLGEHC